MSIYSKEQLNEIDKGRNAGIDVSVYSNPKYSATQMYQIRQALMDGLPIKSYLSPDLTSEQINVIVLGLKKGVNVSKLAKPELTASQMTSILNQLLKEEGVRNFKLKERKELERAKNDPNSYYHKAYVYKGRTYSYRQMAVIQHGLNEGYDVSVYEDPRFVPEQMKAILDGLRAGVPVRVYAKLGLSPDKMNLIRKGLIKGLDVTTYANPDFSYQKMKDLYLIACEEHKPVQVKGPATVTKASDNRSSMVRSSTSKVKERERRKSLNQSRENGLVSNAVKTMRIHFD